MALAIVMNEGLVYTGRKTLVKMSEQEISKICFLECSQINQFRYQVAALFSSWMVLSLSSIVLKLQVFESR